MRQEYSDNWNNYPSCVVDNNGDIVVAGSFYNDGDPTNTHYVWSIMKLSGQDGTLLWARYFDNIEKYDMYDMEDDEVNLLEVRGDFVYYAGHVYDSNDNNYIAIAGKFDVSGAGTGTWGRWVYRVNSDSNASWVDQTSSAVILDMTLPQATDRTSFATAPGGVSVTSDAVGDVTGQSVTIGGAGGITNISNIEFADGSKLTTAGIPRHSIDTGDYSIWLTADMNGKFRYYDNNPNGWSSTIYIPHNDNTELPIGFVLTVVISDFNNQSVYVNNGGNGDVIIRGSGTSNQSGAWVFANDGTYGIYTIMKVDTNTWMLAGPSVNTD